MWRRTNHLAVVVAALAAFLLSTGYYSALAGEMLRLHTADPAMAARMMRPSAWKVLAEVGRTVVVAYVLAWLTARLGTRGFVAALSLAVLLWVAFSAVMWTGAVMWEGVPVELAAIHAGDWLVKTALITVIVSAWRR